MSEDADPVWRELNYDEAWGLFDAQFEFRPDYYDRETPAIRLPERSLVIDLAPVFTHEGARFAAGESAVNAAGLRAFVWLAGDTDLVALDWQHPAYRYSPAAHALANVEWSIPVFPNGDYYIHSMPDLSWGTFGHPWQQTLTIWGDPLIEALGAELLAWLPKHEQDA